MKLMKHTHQASTIYVKNTVIPEDIKKLIAKKKREAKFQQTQTPTDRTKCNRASNQLKARIRNLWEKSFNGFIINLSRSVIFMLYRIDDESPSKECIPEHHFGFRHDHSTDTSNSRWNKSTHRTKKNCISYL